MWENANEYTLSWHTWRGFKCSAADYSSSTIVADPAMRWLYTKDDIRNDIRKNESNSLNIAGKSRLLVSCLSKISYIFSEKNTNPVNSYKALQYLYAQLPSSAIIVAFAAHSLPYCKNNQ